MITVVKLINFVVILKNYFKLMFLIGIYTLNYIKSSFYSDIIIILLIIDFILIGGVLPLIERKYLSTIQRRVGPKYVGYKGRLQFIADALKLFLKEYFLLAQLNKYMYYILPVLLFNISMIILINIVWGQNLFLLDLEINLVFILVISAITHLIIFLTGFFSRNKYANIASKRVLKVFFINELLLTIIVCQFTFWASSFSFSNYMIIQTLPGIILFFSYLPVFIFLILIDINRVPFDYAEAESELIMGVSTEFNGFLFGLYTLVEYLHIFFFSYFIVIFFFF